jgi:Holliday junction resolvase RusA-like endonuclease
MTFPSSFTFFAEGTPRPQGSKRAFLRNGRIVMVEANPELRAWREIVALAAKMQIHADLVHPSFDGPVGVQLLFVMPKPKSVKRVFPSVAPDLDKLCRAVFDGLTDAQVWADDSLACKLTASKVYVSGVASPGVYVTVTKLLEE